MAAVTNVVSTGPATELLSIGHGYGLKFGALRKDVQGYLEPMVDCLPKTHSLETSGTVPSSIYNGHACTCTPKDTHNIHSSIIFNSPKLKLKCPPTIEWINKYKYMHTMEYVYQQGNYSCTKQRDESRKHYVE